MKKEHKVALWVTALISGSVIVFNYLLPLIDAVSEFLQVKIKARTLVNQLACQKIQDDESSSTVAIGFQDASEQYEDEGNEG